MILQVTGTVIKTGINDSEFQDRETGKMVKWHEENITLAVPLPDLKGMSEMVPIIVKPSLPKWIRKGQTITVTIRQFKEKRGVATIRCTTEDLIEKT